MDELAQVDILRLAEVKHGEEAVAQNAGQARVGEHRDLIYALGLFLGLSDEVLEYVFEVGDGDVLLEVFILENFLIDQLDAISLLLSIFHSL